MTETGRAANLTARWAGGSRILRVSKSERLVDGARRQAIEEVPFYSYIRASFVVPEIEQLPQYLLNNTEPSLRQRNARFHSQGHPSEIT